MPEICHFCGIVITMYKPDYNPPHFYVRYNEYRALIDILMGRCHAAHCIWPSSGSTSTSTKGYG